METQTGIKVQNVLLTLIDRPGVPDRLSIDPEYIRELAASIAVVGLISPIVLCPRDGRYEIVAGDCRFQAHLFLGRTEIAAIVQELDVESVAITRATENLQRKDLTIIEEARIYKTLHEKHEMTWEQIAKRTGKTPGLVKRRCDLLKMPEMIVTALHEKKIGYAVAEELCRLNDLSKIEYYLGFCVDHGASLRVVGDWVREELARVRQAESVAGGGDYSTGTFEMKPVYVACDLCSGPMEIGKEKTLRLCKDCHTTIRNNM